MPGFDYQASPHQRRHGPVGYKNAIAYRPWLRDEFTFRCVYCLHREQWGKLIGEFDVEHFQPQVCNPELGLTYDNLLYACHSCNLIKGSANVPDPSQVLTLDTVRVHPDGAIEGRSRESKRLIAILGLDSESYRKWRLIWMRNIELAERYDPAHFNLIMGFPDDLPRLGDLPTSNTRPEGIQQSWFAKKQRNELPMVC